MCLRESRRKGCGFPGLSPVQTKKVTASKFTGNTGDTENDYMRRREFKKKKIYEFFSVVGGEPKSATGDGSVLIRLFTHEINQSLQIRKLYGRLLAICGSYGWG